MPKTNKELLQKAAITTSDLVGGGLMLPSQARAFIKVVRDVTALLQTVRVVTMPTPKFEIDKIGVGQRITRGASENEDVSAYTQKPSFGKIELDAKKYMLPWEMTEESLEDNIEGGDLATTVRDLFAEQMGLDMEDVALNGDTTQPSATTITANLDGSTDPIDIPAAAVTGFPRNSEAGWLKVDNEYFSYEYIDTLTFKNCRRAQNGSTIAAHTSGAALTYVKHYLIGVDDGWLKQMADGASNYVDLSAINSGNIAKDHFFALYRALPQRFSRGARKVGLRWMMGSTQWIKYLEYLTERATAGGDAVIAGAEIKPLGIPVIEVPSMPEDAIILTDPMNLIVGFWRRIKTKFTATDKESIMADKMFWNTSVRWDFRIEEEEGVAFGNGLTTG